MKCISWQPSTFYPLGSIYPLNRIIFSLNNQVLGVLYMFKQHSNCIQLFIIMCFFVHLLLNNVLLCPLRLAFATIGPVYLVIFNIFYITIYYFHLKVSGLTEQLSVLQDAFHHLISRNPNTFWTSGQWMTERKGGSDVGECFVKETERQEGDRGLASSLSSSSSY